MLDAGGSPQPHIFLDCSHLIEGVDSGLAVGFDDGPGAVVALCEVGWLFAGHTTAQDQVSQRPVVIGRLNDECRCLLVLGQVGSVVAPIVLIGELCKALFNWEPPIIFLVN